MTLKPRWVHPVSFRQQDLQMLDAAVQIAKSEGSNLTTIIRDALREYTESKLKASGAKKIDEYLDNSKTINPLYLDVLTPYELKKWLDAEVLSFAKQIRARKQELDFEMRRRGFFFLW